MIDTAETLLCRGMHDMLPDEMVRFRRVEDAFRAACRSWGYSEIRTPTLEHLYLFTSSGTLSPQLLGRVYSFLDWDGWTGERVVLRPDATIAVARLFRERLNVLPAKLAYVANIFRFSNDILEPREVWQCGAELIGESWPLGDVELIRMALDMVRHLGLNEATIRLSHSGVVRALFQQAGFTLEEQAELFDRLLDGDRDVVGDIEVRLPQLGPALRLLTSIEVAGPGFVANLRSAFLAAVPGMAGPLDELELMTAAAQTAGVSVEVSVTAVRDFEYYTGPVFHVSVGDTVVAGGGRYDRLITNADGQPLPACGFALNVDNLLPLVRFESDWKPPAVAIVPGGPSAAALAAAGDVAAELQAAGMPAALVAAPGSAWTLRLSADGAGQLSLEGAGAAQTVELRDVASAIAWIRGG